MSAERDNPRGPTSEQLRRRVLAVERHAARHTADVAAFAPLTGVRRCDYCGSPSPHGCPSAACGYHGR